MSKIIKAIVKSNSVDDSYARVKLASDGIWTETGLVCSINGIALKTGDSVYVDVSDGYECPLILGRALDNTNKFEYTHEGSILFESSNGSDWTLGFVNLGKLKIVNSEGTTIVVDGANISIESDQITINGGDNKGLVKVQELTRKINALEADLNEIKSIFTIWTVLAGDGGLALKTAATSWASQAFVPTKENEIMNDKVKH